MCLQGNAQSIDDQETTKFAKWILDIGDGVIGNQNDGYATIEIPEYLLITEYNDPIDAIVKSTFPDLYEHHSNPEFFKCRAILASTNETVEEVNDYILSLIPGIYAYLKLTKTNIYSIFVLSLTLHVYNYNIPKKTPRQSSFRMSPKQVDTYIILIIHGKRTCK